MNPASVFSATQEEGERGATGPILSVWAEVATEYPRKEDEEATRRFELEHVGRNRGYNEIIVGASNDRKTDPVNDDTDDVAGQRLERRLSGRG